jgi:hypothetical protein
MQNRPPVSIPFHHHVEERHRYFAALVEPGDDRGVPGAAASCLDALTEIGGAVEHLGQALGDQRAGEPGGSDRSPADRRRIGGVVDRAFLGNQVEAAHQPAGRPGNVLGEHGQQGQHHAAAHARVGAVDDAGLRVGSREVERQPVVLLGHRDGDLVDAAVALM